MYPDAKFYPDLTPDKLWINFVLAEQIMGWKTNRLRHEVMFLAAEARHATMPDTRHLDRNPSAIWDDGHWRPLPNFCWDAEKAFWLVEKIRGKPFSLLWDSTVEQYSCLFVFGLKQHGWAATAIALAAKDWLDKGGRIEA